MVAVTPGKLRLWTAAHRAPGGGPPAKRSKRRSKMVAEDANLPRCVTTRSGTLAISSPPSTGDQSPAAADLGALPEPCVSDRYRRTGLQARSCELPAPEEPLRERAWRPVLHSGTSRRIRTTGGDVDVTTSELFRSRACQSPPLVLLFRQCTHVGVRPV